MTERTDVSLRRDLLLRLWLPLLGLLLASAVAAYALARHYAERVYDRWLWDSAMSLATLLSFEDGKARIELPSKTVRLFEWDSTDRIYSEVVSRRQGRLYGDAVFPPPPAEPRGEHGLYHDGVIGGESVRIVAIEADVPDGVDDVVTVQVAETGRKRGLLARQLLVASVPLQIAVLLLAAMLVWHAVASGMRVLDTATRRLAHYDPKRLRPITELQRSPLEIRPLGAALNDLIERLADAQQAQQRLVANAAHQMRTPLAALQVQTERALRETDPADHREALAHVVVAVRRLRHLTHQILTLSRSEAAAQGALSMREVDLAEIAREEIEAHADRALALGSDLGYDGPDDAVIVHGNGPLLRELIANLLDNALNYAAAGAVVTLVLRREPLVLCVDDDGPGIAAEERELVLERFYRGAGSGGDGCGLGLSIASEIAARHGAALDVTDPPHGRGTRVRVRFAMASAGNDVPA
ncbi:sensor histidine kinase [Dokdonella sp.]|uniref:sensor histidine kinase n=1 Tax=Dokdonella sp. TaxID=2291710 RepID=UPI0026331AB0|nr:sensor histidine kinase [Dokdonella sp.]